MHQRRQPDGDYSLESEFSLHSCYPTTRDLERHFCFLLSGPVINKVHIVLPEDLVQRHQVLQAVLPDVVNGSKLLIDRKRFQVWTAGRQKQALLESDQCRVVCESLGCEAPQQREQKTWLRRRRKPPRHSSLNVKKPQ